MSKQTVEKMFEVGAHFGFMKSRRHPSVKPYIFGAKNSVEIFDLEKTVDLLEEAKKFVKEAAKEDKQMLFVAGKREAVSIIKEEAQKVDQPYVAGRFIGGTLTNFEEIQKRTSRLEDLTAQKDKGQLAKYTKKERLMIDREIDKLTEKFGGILNMKKKPGVVFVIDAKQEHIAVAEAVQNNIPVVALCSSDCDISKIQYPIVANDSSLKSIKYFVNEIVEAYEAGAKQKKSGGK